MFFECNIPDVAPAYINPMSKSRYNQMAAAIHKRTDKLNEALDYCDMDPDTFAEYAAELFKTHPSRFDQMDVADLVRYVNVVHDESYQAVPRLEWPNATVLVDCRFLTTTEWEVLRVLGIGGSDASVVRQMNGHRSRWDLYMDKTMAPEKYVNPLEKKQSQVFFDRGHAMEDKVIAAFCDATGAVRIPEHRMFASKQYPHNTANIDAILRMPNNELVVFEAKTAVTERITAWSAERIPIEYVPQMRQYPSVLADERIKGTYIGVLFTYDYTVNGFFVGADSNVSEFRHRFIARDEMAEQEHLQTNEEFFTSHVLAQNPPPFDCSPTAALESLTRYTGMGDSSVPDMELDEDLRENVQSYLALKKEQDTLNKRLKDLQLMLDAEKLAIVETMGEGEYASMPSDTPDMVYEVKYAHRQKVIVDAKKLEEYHPGAFHDCTSLSEWRQFSITEKDAQKVAKARAKAKKQKA